MKALSAAFHDAIAEAGCKPDEIRGASYCSQANTFLLLDRSDKPLTPLIVWALILTKILTEPEKWI